MQYDLKTSSHAVYNLNYRLILVTKCRQDVFDDQEIVDELKRRTVDIAERYGVEVRNQEVDSDHLYLLIATEPTTDLTKFINALKTGTSKAIRHRYDIEDKLWNDVFWSDSYCLITTGEVTLDQLQQYVEQQGEPNQPQ